MCGVGIICKMVLFGCFLLVAGWAGAFWCGSCLRVFGFCGCFLLILGFSWLFWVFLILGLSYLLLLVFDFGTCCFVSWV